MTLTATPPLWCDQDQAFDGSTIVGPFDPLPPSGFPIWGFDNYNFTDVPIPEDNVFLLNVNSVISTFATTDDLTANISINLSNLNSAIKLYGTVDDLTVDPPIGEPLIVTYQTPYSNDASPPTAGFDCRLVDGNATITQTTENGTPPYTYSAVNLPPGCSIDVNTGVITLSPLNTQPTDVFGAATMTVTDAVLDTDDDLKNWERIAPAGPA